MSYLVFWLVVVVATVVIVLDGNKVLECRFAVRVDVVIPAVTRDVDVSEAAVDFAGEIGGGHHKVVGAAAEDAALEGTWKKKERKFFNDMQCTNISVNKLKN